MNHLDLNGPAPKAKTLEEAQQTIDALWSALGEAMKRIEQLEEQLRSDSRDSSQSAVERHAGEATEEASYRTIARRPTGPSQARASPGTGIGSRSDRAFLSGRRLRLWPCVSDR
jgi:hypothetical protein